MISPLFAARSKNDPDAGLKSKIKDGKRGIADSGFRGEPKKLSISREQDTAEVSEMKRRAKSRQETVFSRLKTSKFYAMCFAIAFEACCVLIQYDMENGHPLFEV
jgi:hypothetical protein